MKIFQVGTYPKDRNLIKGGVEASIYGLTNELSRNNELFVISLPDKEISDDFKTIEGNVTIYRFSNNTSNNLGSLLRIRELVKIILKEKPEICHLHSTSIFNFILLLFFKFKRIPFVLTVHGLTHIEQKNNLKRESSLRSLLKYFIYSFSEFVILSLSKKIIVDTRYVADSIKRYRSEKKVISLPAISIIPQGINEDYFSIQDKAERNQILSVGSINRRKGFEYSIKAIEQLKSRIHDIHLTIIGIASDRNYLAELMNYIQKNKLDNNVSILTNLSFSEIKQHYEKCNIFILHSQEESQGIVFAEAMACGKPIVATNVGGIPFVLKDNVNAFLSEYGDINTFADNIYKIFNSDTIRSSMSKQNKIDSKNYKWKFITQRVLNIYEEICY